MVKLRRRGESVRRFILEHVEQWPGNIGAKTAEHFGVTRQAVYRHLARLVKEGALSVEGRTIARVYRLGATETVRKTYTAGRLLAEDLAWRELMEPIIADLPDNVRALRHHGFTEMFNSAIDHSDGEHHRADRAGGDCDDGGHP